MKTTDIGVGRFPEDFVADPETAFIKVRSTGDGAKTSGCVHYDETLIDKLNQAFCNHYTREEIMDAIERILNDG